MKKKSVEFLKQSGVNTFEQYKYYMTQDLETINLIVDYTNEFIKWTRIDNEQCMPYFSHVSHLPEPTDQYIGALKYVWDKYSGVV